MINDYYSALVLVIILVFCGQFVFDYVILRVLSLFCCTVSACNVSYCIAFAFLRVFGNVCATAY
jgi:hypothetical protein